MEIISWITLIIIIFIAILETLNYFKRRTDDLKTGSMIDKKDYNGGKKIMPDAKISDIEDEEVIAAISAAIKTYSCGKEIILTKIKKMDEKCLSNGWLIHAPQTFWRIRKG